MSGELRLSNYLLWQLVYSGAVCYANLPPDFMGFFGAPLRTIRVARGDSRRNSGGHARFQSLPVIDDTDSQQNP